MAKKQNAVRPWWLGAVRSAVIAATRPTLTTLNIAVKAATPRCVCAARTSHTVNPCFAAHARGAPAQSLSGIAVAARAIWKGTLAIGRSEIPVKLYAAVEDRTVHFHLLEKRTPARVKQAHGESEYG